MKLALVIATHNRILDAKVQMDLVRDIWPQEKLLSNITIIHSYNGNNDSYKKKYREDVLIRRESKGLFEGATDLINTGVLHALNNSQKFDYILVTSADVWLLKPEKLAQTLNILSNRSFHLATSRWWPTLYATEFFIISSQLAKKVFPLNLDSYKEKHKIHTKLSQTPTRWALLELCFTEMVNNELKNSDFPNKQVYFFPDMPYVNYYINRNYNKDFGYTSHHDPKKKMETIKNLNLLDKLPTLQHTYLPT